MDNACKSVGNLTGCKNKKRAIPYPGYTYEALEKSVLTGLLDHLKVVCFIIVIREHCCMVLCRTLRRGLLYLLLEPLPKINQFKSITLIRGQEELI